LRSKVLSTSGGFILWPLYFAAPNGRWRTARFDKLVQGVVLLANHFGGGEGRVSLGGRAVQPFVPKLLASVDWTYRHTGSSAIAPSAPLYRERITLYRLSIRLSLKSVLATDRSWRKT
jgi:hypothetical protein